MFSLAGATLHTVLAVVLLFQTLCDCVKFLKCIKTDAEIESQITECIDQMFNLQAGHFLDTFFLLSQIGLSVSALAQGSVALPYKKHLFCVVFKGQMSLWICFGC